MSASPTRRGRPATVTADHLADIALRLWDEHGFDEVPLGDVAREAGVTVRTLLRYFPSKADIVWHPLAASIGDLAGHLAGTSSAETIAGRVRLGILASLAEVQNHDATRLRLLVIGRTPTLHANTSGPFVAWRAVIRDFATAERGLVGADMAADAFAAAVQATTMAALTWWAGHADRTPIALVDRALRDLESGFADPARSG
jgi:AcrR family transcriptional regulator